MSWRWFIPVLLVLGAMAGTGARAAEPGPFIAAVSAAYPQFKMAWFYCRTGNDFLAQEELESFVAAWRRIDGRFRDAPPTAFARDAQWKTSLGEVAASLDRAAGLVRAGKARDAMQPLAAVRRALGALRRRNGVVIFSDHVDAYGAVVDRLVALRGRTRSQTALTDADIKAYAALAGELRAAVAKLRERAPADLKGDSGFTGSLEGNLASIDKLERNIRSRQAKAIYGSVAAVRADYILLFTRYG